MRLPLPPDWIWPAVLGFIFGLAVGGAVMVAAGVVPALWAVGAALIGFVGGFVGGWLAPD